jgi:DNA-binding response OmpR family regulator
MADSSILLVHSDEEVIAGVQEALNGQGYHLEISMDGLDALSRLEDHPPALVIADTMLPQLDGITLVKVMRSQAGTRDTPVIFVSERVDPTAMLMGLAAGARYYVTIPFNPADLLFKVQRLLSS